MIALFCHVSLSTTTTRNMDPANQETGSDPFQGRVTHALNSSSYALGSTLIVELLTCADPMFASASNVLVSFRWQPRIASFPMAHTKAAGHMHLPSTLSNNVHVFPPKRMNEISFAVQAHSTRFSLISFVRVMTNTSDLRRNLGILTEVPHWGI